VVSATVLVVAISTREILLPSVGKNPKEYRDFYANVCLQAENTVCILVVLSVHASIHPCIVDHIGRTRRPNGLATDVRVLHLVISYFVVLHRDRLCFRFALCRCGTS